MSTQQGYKKNSTDVDFLLTELGKLNVAHPFKDGQTVGQISVPDSDITVILTKCTGSAIADMQNPDPVISSSVSGLPEAVADLLKNGRKFTFGTRTCGDLSVFEISIA